MITIQTKVIARGKLAPPVWKDFCEFLTIQALRAEAAKRQPEILMVATEE
jgi:hypothetical protein